MELVNGGGTGSLHTTSAEHAVTELTAGSGFYAPTLFDRYSSFTLRPAAMFALPVVRRPGPGTVTLLGGGYHASGAAGKDRLPEPYLPAGLKLDSMEGAGEVQTPVSGEAAAALRVGDNVYMRHAKAGELCERFDSAVPRPGGRGGGRGSRPTAAKGRTLPLRPDQPQPFTFRRVACQHDRFDAPPPPRSGPARLPGAGRPCAGAGHPPEHAVRDDRRPDGRVAAGDEQAARRPWPTRARSFTRAISTYPLCCPSRATYLTGQYSHNHGVIHNAGPFGGYTAAEQREHAAGMDAAARATGRSTWAAT